MRSVSKQNLSAAVRANRREKAKKYWESHKAEKKAYDVLYRSRNLDRKRRVNKLWADNNKEKIKA